MMMEMRTSEQKVQIPDRMYFRIGDVAELLHVKPYVLRYWETEFPMVSPQKSNSGQRVYRRSDVENLVVIRHLLYEERYSIEGARKRLKELRKDGELKAVKEGILAQAVAVQVPVFTPLETKLAPEPVQDQVGVSKECWAQAQTLAQEIRELVARPITDIFRY